MTATNLLRDLIRIPSVNPDGDPGTALTGENECAHFVAEVLRSSGAETLVEDVLPGRRLALQRPELRPVQTLSAGSLPAGPGSPASCSRHIPIR